MTTECVHGDYRVTIFQFLKARSQHYSLFQKWYKDAIITGQLWKLLKGIWQPLDSVERICKECNLIAVMSFFSIKSLALKWNYFFPSGIIVFVEYVNLYMKQLLLQSRTGSSWGVPPWLKGAMSRSARLPSSTYFFILDSESEIKEKRGGRDLGQFVVFVLAPCCWDDNFELELVSFMTISCQILVGNDKELEGHDLHAWLRGIFDARANI